MPTGSGDFWKLFTIYGCGSNVDHVTKPICVNFHFCTPKIFHMVFVSKQLNSFWENQVTCGKGLRMTLTFDPHVGSLDHFVDASTNFEIIGCNSFGKMNYFHFFPLSLKVGSCPNDDNSVQILFCPFLCSIWIVLCSESVAAEKSCKTLLKFMFFHLFISFVLEFRF